MKLDMRQLKTTKIFKIEWQNNVCYLNEQRYKYSLKVIEMDRFFVGDQTTRSSYFNSRAKIDMINHF